MFTCVAAGIALLSTSASGQKAPRQSEQSWNSNAITAVFDGILMDDGNHLRFFYVLKNTTGTEYRLLDGSNADLMLSVERNGKPSLAPSEGKFKMDYPIIVRAKNQRILMITDVSRTYDFKQKLPMHATPEQQQEYEKSLAAFLRSQQPDLDGFVLMDKRKRYRINLPRGW